MSVATAHADVGRRAPEHLPPLVRDYVERAVPEGVAWPRHVHLEQTGTMCLRRGGAWKPFTARQELAAERTFFEWRARMAVAGPLKASAIDRIDGSHGELDARLLGVRVAHAEGASTDLGELMRYVAEIPWNPGAIALHPGLAWDDRGDGVVDVRLHEGDLDATVRFRFDEHGNITEASASRPFEQGRRIVRTPWAGRFSRYRRLGGIRIPTYAEVRWELPQGPYPYFRGELRSFEVRS
ncbi:MAG: DUF6544 family protein [Myxococcota bacterium]